MKHLCPRIFQLAVLLAVVSFNSLAVLPSGALAQEGQVTREDLNKILQRLDELTKKNVELEKKNEEVIRTNQQLTTRIKALEQQPAPGRGGAQMQPGVTELSTRVQNLESQLQASGGRAGGEAADVAQLKEDVKELSGIMQEVEKKTLTDKVRIGAELRTRLDWFNYSTQFKHTYGTKSQLFNRGDHPTDEHVSAMPTLRFRLNLSTELMNNLKLHARLTMYKIWNDDEARGYPYTNFMNPSRHPTDSDLRVERVYADYFFKIWEKFPMVFTFGRLPTTDSFPTDLRDDTPRKSTYPGLAFDGEGDGVALSTDMSQLTGLPDSALRLVWCRYAPDNEYGIWKEDDNHLTDLDFYTLQFETGLPGRLKDTLLVFNMLYMPEVSSPELASIDYISPIQLPGDLGNLLKFTFFIESKRFLETRFDWFAGYSFLKSHAAGEPAVFGIAGIPVKRLGLLNSNGTSDEMAHAFHVGFRYTFPWEMLNEPKFGFEYNRNSKYWFGLNQGAEDPLMKLDARGASVYDFYYIQPINDNFLFRFGYTLLHSRYTGLWMYGDTPKVKERISNMYLLMDARF